MTTNDVYVQPIPIPVPIASSPQFKTHSGTLDERQTSELVSQGYTSGMTKAIGNCVNTFPLRIWLVDNSGSMATSDGNRMVNAKNGELKSVSCTRWKEIQETVDYHVHLSALLRAPTTFRLLNNPGQCAGQQIFSVADKGDWMIPSDAEIARNTMNNAYPSGVTPLSKHIYEIREQVVLMAPNLNAQGCKVTIVLATDGLPTDSRGTGGKIEQMNFLEAMRSLEGLPVWIVIRLCTDNDAVVEFYNDLDRQLELSVEVLDNFTSEAEETYKKNKWINYTLPLHRIREMGFQHRIFDLLDERALTLSELRDFCILLFGVDQFDGVPDPEIDFKGFIRAINTMMKKEKKQWNTVKNKLKPLLDLEKMSEIYGDDSCSIM